MVPMTENERRILAELTREAPLSKRDITLRCGMGWATAVKLMSRLEEQGVIVPAGSERQSGAGKTATVYTLSPLKPAAIGIDVEYARVRLTVRNLAGAALFETRRATPALAGPDELTDFLSTLIVEAEAEAAGRGVDLAGAGIGVPSHLFDTLGMPYAATAERLTARHAMPVRIDNNIRCFTAGIIAADAGLESALVVTVRSGIGVGVVIGGRIYQGDNGSAGEIGHFPVDGAGGRCRCGKIGCLETVVNRDRLAADFAALAAGDDGARARLDAAAGLLGRAIGTAMLVLDVRRAVVFSELGDDGHALVAPMRAGVAAVMLPGFNFDVGYDTLDPEAYVVGAARLVLNDFVR
jgi:predicted NBD/HSP70 family sugar kinase